MKKQLTLTEQDLIKEYIKEHMDKDYIKRLVDVKGVDWCIEKFDVEKKGIFKITKKLSSKKLYSILAFHLIEWYSCSFNKDVEEGWINILVFNIYINLLSFEKGNGDGFLNYNHEK